MYTLESFILTVCLLNVCCFSPKNREAALYTLYCFSAEYVCHNASVKLATLRNVVVLFALLLSS